MSVCEVDPASMYQRGGSIFIVKGRILLFGMDPSCVKGWIQLLHPAFACVSILYIVYGHQILSTTCCRCLIDYLAPKNE